MSYKRISPQPVIEGGTGAVTLTNHGALIGAGTGAVTAAAPGAVSGKPLISQGASADPVFGIAEVVGGGTGGTTFTAYSLIAAGTTSTGSFQNVSGVGTSGQVLTSNGAGALPTWQAAAASGIVTIAGDSGTATGSTVTFNANSNCGSSVVFAAATSTVSLKVSDVNDNTIIGASAGNGTLTGQYNTVLGFQAAQAFTNGNHNCLVGYSAGLSLTGGLNTAVGSTALVSLTSGTYNTCLGYGAGGAYSGSESSNICISNPGVAAESNVMRLGQTGSSNQQVDTVYVAGTYGVNVGSVATVVTMSSGEQIGTATITAGTGITVTPGANTITIAASATGFTWSVITANQTAAVNNGYFCNKAGTLTLALPAASAVGDVIEVTNENTALGVQFTQSAGQQILIGNTNTTSGATGTLTSSAVGDTLKIVCKVANTIWRVTSEVGNWTPA